VQQVFWMLLLEQEIGEFEEHEGESATTAAANRAEATMKEVKAIANSLA
jgi:hypothetical protein